MGYRGVRDIRERHLSVCSSHSCDSDLYYYTYIDNKEMMQLKHQLSAMFKMTDMGNLSYCLGIGVRQGEGWLQIQQHQYLLNIVKWFGLEDAHPVADVSVTLEADDGVSN